jgi:hypothetical protein
MKRRNTSRIAFGALDISPDMIKGSIGITAKSYYP